MLSLRIEFSTDHVHPRDRFSLFHDVACRSFVHHDCKADQQTGFHAEIKVAPLGHVALATYAHAPLRVSRTQQHMQQDQSDDLYFGLQVRGTCHVSQDGRDAFLQEGDLCLLDTARSYELRYPENSNQLVLKIPRPQIEARIGKLSSLTAVRIPGESPAGSFTSGFMRLLPSCQSTLPFAPKVQIGNQALDLVGLALAEPGSMPGLKLSSTASIAFLRVKQAVEANLTNRYVDCEAIASSAGVSVRYANKLLSQEGTSLERLLQERRLEKCRQALDDDKYARQPIGDIAYAWGFASASHFARSFRAAYSVTPRDYRNRSRRSS